MIRSFKDRLSEDLFHGRETSVVRRFPAQLRRVAQRKFQYLNAAMGLSDLRVPPGNHLELLKGDWWGRYSIRINVQWRIVFRWKGQDAHEVQVVDYH